MFKKHLTSLKTIENLYNKGMLSEEEYKRKRNEILKGI